MMDRLYSLYRRQEGQAMVEYALIIALVAVLLIGSLTALQVGIDGVFDAIVGAFA